MDLLLRAGWALSLRTFASLVFIVFIVILALAAGTEAAFGADVVSVQPLPQPDSGGLTMAWTRDFAIFIFCVGMIGLFIWRVSVVDGLASKLSAILDDEMDKRKKMKRGR